MNAISKFNFGDLKKIAWNRATRTDKSVHALQNVFSCKVHISKEERESNDGLENFRKRLNEALDKESKCKSEVIVFTVIEVSNRFNSKLSTSHREYCYFLPSFMLSNINQFYLGKLGTNQEKEEDSGIKKEDITN
jgi:tRNA pseudouridine(38-40) synthase